MMIDLPVPAALNGRQLQDELHAAGLGDAEVAVLDDRLQVTGTDDETTVRAVVERHVPAGTPVQDPDADLALRIQAVHDDPQVSASVKKLTAALLGLNGEAAVAGRPTDAGR